MWPVAGSNRYSRQACTGMLAIRCWRQVRRCEDTQPRTYRYRFRLQVMGNEKLDCSTICDSLNCPPVTFLVPVVSAVPAQVFFCIVAVFLRPCRQRVQTYHTSGSLQSRLRTLSTCRPMSPSSVSTLTTILPYLQSLRTQMYMLPSAPKLTPILMIFTLFLSLQLLCCRYQQQCSAELSGELSSTTITWQLLQFCCYRESKKYRYLSRLYRLYPVEIMQMGDYYLMAFRLYLPVAQWYSA